MTQPLIPCLICGATPDSVHGGAEPPWAQDLPAQPHGATVFKAKGNYGSTVYDPPMAFAGSRWLQINICDPCLVAKASEGFVVEVELAERREDVFAARAWVPGLDVSP